MTDKHPKRSRDLKGPLWRLRHNTAQMACATSPLDVPLHPNLGVLAQRRGRLLRQAHKAPPQARRLTLPRWSPGRYQSLPCQLHPKAPRPDRRSKTRAGRCQAREGSVRVNPQAKQKIGVKSEHHVRRVWKLRCLAHRSIREGNWRQRSR